jgi:aryl-alcohol dehydrogenase-like predicted oxidoreductase
MTSKPLERRPLGRTSLRTTAMGFGAGGRSRAGLDDGFDHAAAMVAAALGAGVNIIDTAEAYRTESAVAAGIARAGVARDNVIITTKVKYRAGGELRTPAAVTDAVRGRLDALGTDRLDVIQLHGVRPDDYTWARDRLLPELEELRQRGVIRAIGVTEMFALDPGHQMLARAVADGCWDTVMVGYNLINQTARERVIAPAARAGVGVLVMFAVRELLTDIDRLDSYVREQSAAGRLPGDFDADEDLHRLRRVLVRESASLADLAYRFAAATHGVSTVLVGTEVADLQPVQFPERLEERGVLLAQGVIWGSSVPASDTGVPQKQS